MKPQNPNASLQNLLTYSTHRTTYENVTSPRLLSSKQAPYRLATATIHDHVESRESPCALDWGNVYIWGSW